jgi:hypothetical protein
MTVLKEPGTTGTAAKLAAFNTVSIIGTGAFTGAGGTTKTTAIVLGVV